MNRREFSAVFSAGTAGLVLPRVASAQNGPIEGRHYVHLSEPVPTSAGAGKIEVIEFFWYGCPHCNAFEPALDAWSKQLPDFVMFHRVPVAFSSEPFVAHQHIFFALDSMGLVASMQRKVFYAIHHDRMRLDRPEEISKFMEKSGVDAVVFMQAYNSFSTQTKIRQANRLVDGYKIDGVPAIGVQGQYYTSGPLAGDNERALLVADFLVQKIHKSA